MTEDNMDDKDKTKGKMPFGNLKKEVADKKAGAVSRKIAKMKGKK